MPPNRNTGSTTRPSPLAQPSLMVPRSAAAGSTMTLSRNGNRVVHSVPPPSAYYFLARKSAPPPWSKPGRSYILVDREGVLYHISGYKLWPMVPDTKTLLHRAFSGPSHGYLRPLQQVENELGSGDASYALKRAPAKVILIECGSALLLNVLARCDPQSAALYGYVPPPIPDTAFFAALRDVDTLRFRIAVPILKQSLRDMPLARAWEIYVQCCLTGWDAGAAIAAKANFAAIGCLAGDGSYASMGSIMERGRAHEFRAVMDYAYECGKQLDDRIVKPGKGPRGVRVTDVSFLTSEDIDTSIFKCDHRADIPRELIRLGDGHIVEVNRWFMDGLRLVQAKLKQRPSVAGSRAMAALTERGVYHCRPCARHVMQELEGYMVKLDAHVETIIEPVSFESLYMGFRRQWNVVES